MNERVRFASFISGGGSTMEAMARATQENGELYGMVEPALVVASKPEAGGIEKARSMGVPVEVVVRRDYENMDAYGEALIKVLDRYSPDLVTLNGFLVKVPEMVIEEYLGRIFNQHPGPVPEFGGKGMYGKRVHAAVLKYVRETGMDDPHTRMTAQRVAVEYDMGKVVGSRDVEILPNDTVESLQERSLPVEHELQIQLLKDFAVGNVTEMELDSYAETEDDFIVLERVKEEAINEYPNG